MATKGQQATSQATNLVLRLPHLIVLMGTLHFTLYSTKCMTNSFAHPFILSSLLNIHGALIDVSKDLSLPVTSHWAVVNRRQKSF